MLCFNVNIFIMILFSFKSSAKIDEKKTIVTIYFSPKLKMHARIIDSAYEVCPEAIQPQHAPHHRCWELTCSHITELYPTEHSNIGYFDT